MHNIIVKIQSNYDLPAKYIWLSDTFSGNLDLGATMSKHLIIISRLHVEFKQYKAEFINTIANAISKYLQSP